MRIVFAGTPAVAEPTLRALHGEHEIVAVITRQDALFGRRRVLTPSPVAVVAEQLGIPVIRANKLDSDVTTEVTQLQADLGVIVAYGGLVREPLLSTPKLGWINLHFSVLPRWRGAAPVQHAVIAGDKVTGATVFQLVPELDAGPIYATATQRIGQHHTSGQLLETLARDGANLVTGVVNSLARGEARAVPQEGEVTLAPKLSLADARLNWNEGCDAIYRRMRGVTPEPGAFTMIESQRFKILDAEPALDGLPLPPGSVRLQNEMLVIGTTDTPLRLLRVQPSGKNPMSAADWWRGVSHEGELIAE